MKGDPAHILDYLCATGIVKLDHSLQKKLLVSVVPFYFLYFPFYILISKCCFLLTYSYWEFYCCFVLQKGTECFLCGFDFYSGIFATFLLFIFL